MRSWLADMTDGLDDIAGIGSKRRNEFSVYTIQPR